LHVHVDAAAVRARFEAARGFEQQLPQLRANGFGKGDVGHDAPAEEGMRGRLLGAVDKLVRQHDVAGFVFRLQRTDGAGADDPGDAEFLQGPNVGAVIEFAGHNAMAAAVAGQEDNVAASELASKKIVRRPAKGSFDLHPFLVGESFEVIKAAAANNADAVDGHGGALYIWKARE